MRALRPAGAPPLRTVFLDLGDTLLHIHPSVPTLYLRTARELGLDVDGATVGAALQHGERFYQAAVTERRRFESSLPDARDFWHEYHERVLAGLGVAPGAARAALAQTLTERFWSPGSWRAFPEVLGVLERLRSGGLQLAVVSNFTDALAAVCAAHELSPLLDGLVASTTVGAQKPDAAIFREALRRTGADPAATVHVGDNYTTDVLGARASGIAPILLDRRRAGTPAMFDFTRPDGAAGDRAVRLDCPVIGDLTELLALVV
ncbi:MAG TPA: HAD-IA family hydrolase [Candidatus Dormibacteraeota bacterium]|nr:HAD-IA family hydrolase [Candidatus Dormibacteraeota bacterium]